MIQIWGLGTSFEGRVDPEMDRESRARRVTRVYLWVCLLASATPIVLAGCCAHGGAMTDSILSWLALPVLVTFPSSLLLMRLGTSLGVGISSSLSPSASSALVALFIAAAAMLNALILYLCLGGRFRQRET